MRRRVEMKEEFKSLLKEFVFNLSKQISDCRGEWTIKGIIDIYDNIYTISTDTKIISKILEIHILPEFFKFAKDHDYLVILPEYQNYYPDFTFINKNDNSIKFAVDLKTTYRKKNGLVNFTLGSHGSYFKNRESQKNIQFPYNHYLAHFCLGIVYSRSEDGNNEPSINTSVDNYSNLKSISSVIKDFDFFVAEKWKIASDKQGSGNTANIGTSLSIEDLRNENGIFSKLGEKYFDEYWMNYNTATMLKDGKIVKITSLKDFLEFKGESHLIDLLNKGKDDA